MATRCQPETARLRYGINDIHLFYENDVRFLKQF
jgi:phenylalanyl-tRNA synthetase alpha subunit